MKTIRLAHLLLGLLLVTSGPLSAQSGSAAGSAPTGLLTEPRVIERTAALAERMMTRDREQKNGFFVETDHMITGSGWISVGPGYRHRLFRDRAVASASVAVSWRFYNMAHGSLELPRTDRRPWSVGVGALYQDALQVNYFGVGNDTPESARSGYRLQSFDLDGHGSYIRGPLTLQARAGWLPMIDVRPMVGRLPAYPNTGDLYSEASAPGISTQPSFVHADSAITWDVRDRPGRPTRGGTYTMSYANYRDLDRGTYSFHSVHLGAAQYIPLAGERWVAALRGWSAFTGTSGGHVVPFYLMPNVGGKSTIRGYADYRFSGPQMVTLSAESRVGLFSHVDVALFVDAGKVANRIEQFGGSGFRRSVGAGVRLHTTANTVARLDVARGRDGWFAVFKLTEPFERKTFSDNLTPTVPFVP